jgi:protein-S-isoprenylcysteine O-methyltransferase Ste14
MAYSSKAGYIGGLFLSATAFGHYFLERSALHSNISWLEIGPIEILLFSIILCFFCMLLFELWAVFLYKKNNSINLIPRVKIQNTNLYLIKSSIIRSLSVLLLFFISYFIVKNHYYFQHHSFNITRAYYDFLLYAYLIGSIPYCFITLKYKGGSQYELNDYGILLLISYRSILKLLELKFKGIFIGTKVAEQGINKCIIVHRQINKDTRTATFIKNKRIVKVYLVFLINFFFLTLMTKFFMSEYNAFNFAVINISSAAYEVFNDIQRFHAWYLLFYHLIFYIDVGIALIGYTIASRWLNNRTKSIDMTFYGWFMVLLCYPPMNSGFTDQFIGYGRIATHDIVTGDVPRMILMSLILLSFSIYVWATMALGFKFSNLTNRGVISHGPYRFFRHPAYATKNLAWWLDNTHVLSNVWAAAALLAWNFIYILRGITEEKHLIKDIKYQQYKKQVRNRFIPYLWYKKQ